MSATTINHINIRVPAEMLNSVRDFYCAALGLQAGERPNFGSLGYWLYAGDKALIHLSVCKSDEIRSTHIKNALDHVAFDCTDQPAMCARLASLGIPFTHDLVPDRPIRQVFFSDPAGNGIELSFAQ
ncbi:catechol 2,3-dioxygenase-like lactoylglutathione lyase family enzyme [Oxalobacteraceae bacterium GrIS 2.11]